MKNLTQLMKQAKAMQSQMATLQQELQETIFTGQAGGVVKVEVNGAMELTSISIDPSVMEDGDAELLEDLIAAAVGNAQSDAREAVKSKLGPLGGGMPGF